MNGPVLIIHTREGCPACVVLHQEQNMKMIRETCNAEGVELRVFTHKFTGGRVNMVEKEKYPKLDPPVFPTFMMVPSSEAHLGGDISKIKVYNYELRKTGRSFELIRGSEKGISLPTVQKWVISTGKAMSGHRPSIQTPQNVPPSHQHAASSSSHQTRSPESSSSRNDTRWRSGRGRTNECKNYKVVYLNR